MSCSFIGGCLLVWFVIVFSIIAFLVALYYVWVLYDNKNLLYPHCGCNTIDHEDSVIYMLGETALVEKHMAVLLEKVPGLSISKIGFSTIDGENIE